MMDEKHIKKSGSEPSETTLTNTSAKIQNFSVAYKESDGKNYINLLDEELKNCTKKLEKEKDKKAIDTEISNIAENLGYTDTQMIERFRKLYVNGPFNDLQLIHPPKFLYNIHGVNCVPSGEVVGIGGKPGTGKTTALAILIGVIMGNVTFGGIRCVTPCHKVLWMDTEKGEYSTQQKMATFRRISDMSENIQLEQCGISFWLLRGERLVDRIAFIELLFNLGKYDCVVIDGIFDLTNDPNENYAPVIELLQRLANHGTTVFAMLHTNKNDDNMRYALGTELTRIATTIFVVNFNKNNGNHTITHEKSNDTALAPPITFRYASDGNVYAPEEEIAIARKKDRRREGIEEQWAQLFEGADSLSYNDILDRWDEKGVKKDTAVQRFRTAKNNGLIIKNAKERWEFAKKKQG